MAVFLRGCFCTQAHFYTKSWLVSNEDSTLLNCEGRLDSPTRVGVQGFQSEKSGASTSASTISRFGFKGLSQVYLSTFYNRSVLASSFGQIGVLFRSKKSEFKGSSTSVAD